jgi:hypothetical protein
MIGVGAIVCDRPERARRRGVTCQRHHHVRQLTSRLIELNDSAYQRNDCEREQSSVASDRNTFSCRWNELSAALTVVSCRQTDRELCGTPFNVGGPGATASGAGVNANRRGSTPARRGMSASGTAVTVSCPRISLCERHQGYW